MSVEFSIDGEKVLEVRREHRGSPPRVNDLPVYLLKRGVPITLENLLANFHGTRHNDDFVFVDAVGAKLNRSVCDNADPLAAHLVALALPLLTAVSLVEKANYSMKP